MPSQMPSPHAFNQVQVRPVSRLTQEHMVLRLAQLAAEQFERLAGFAALPVPVGCPELSDQHKPVHPLCERYIEGPACERFWQAHLEAIRKEPRAHWHRCVHQLWCAVLPVMRKQDCMLVCKLVAPSAVTQEDFEGAVVLLNQLLDVFVTREAGSLSSICEHSESEPDAPGTPHPSVHPQVWKAVEYIHHHLAQSELSVNSVAAQLEMNATYLAHLFAQQVGVRMRQYIANRRLELAKILLSRTDWRIKKVAHETGHPNADWFSHVFREYSGQTPGEFRRSSLAAPSA